MAHEDGYYLFYILMFGVLAFPTLFALDVHVVLLSITALTVDFMMLGVYLKYKDRKRFRGVSDALVYWCPSAALTVVMFIAISISVIYMMLALMIIGMIFVSIAKLIHYKYDIKKDKMQPVKSQPIKESKDGYFREVFYSDGDENKCVYKPEL